MAGSIVQSAYAVDDSGATSGTISVTLNSVVAGNAIAVHIGWGLPAITVTMSDGVAYTSAAPKVDDATNSISGQVFCQPGVSSGTHVIVATFSAVSNFNRIRAFELAGLDTVSPVDVATGQLQATPGTGADGISSGATSTTTNANDFVMVFSQNSTEIDPGTGTVTAGTGYTISGSNVILSAASKNVSALGAQTGLLTQSVNNSRITHVVAFKQASSGPTPGPLMLRRQQVFVNDVIYQA